MTAKNGLAAPIWAQTSTVGVSSTSVDFPGHTAFSSSPRQSYRTQETTSEQIFQNHDLASILHSQLKHIMDSEPEIEQQSIINMHTILQTRARCSWSGSEAV